MFETTLKWYTLDGLGKAHADGEIPDLNLPTTLVALLRQVQYQDKIDTAEHDEDGYWVYLNYGYCTGDDGTHIIHENTIGKVRKQLQRVKPCSCSLCQRAKGFVLCQQCGEHWYHPGDGKLFVRERCPACEMDLADSFMEQNIAWDEYGHLGDY